jgi:hypothetical protein
MINKKATKNKPNKKINKKKKIKMTNSIEPQNHPLAKLFSGILCLIFALAISGVAAFFSVTGLATIFSAAFISVVVMGTVLESGKLVAAAWLHANWKNSRVGFFIKGYLSIAVIALMIITGIGIYGYLSKAYLDQSAPAGVVDIQIQNFQQQIAQDNSNIQRYNDEQKQMDSQIDGLVANNKIYQSQIIRKSQTQERLTVQKEINDAQNDILSLNQKMEPLQIEANGTDAKLGPIKYVAALIGWKDLDAAVRLVILIIMVAFDPLAVVLLLAGTISIGEWMDSRKPKEIIKSIEEIKPLPVVKKEIVIPQIKIPDFVSEPIVEQEIQKENVKLVDVPKEHLETTVEEPILESVEPELAKAMTKEEKTKMLIELLDKNPDIMQEVIDVVSEFNDREKNNITPT